MKRGRINDNNIVLLRKFLYTMVMVSIYILGRNVPLPWVEAAENPSDSMLAYIASITGTDTRKGSVFSLGISPWITSMLIIQLLGPMFRKSGRVLSKSAMRRTILIMTIFNSIIQSVTLLGQLTLKEGIFPYMWQTRLATVISLIGGLFVIIVLSEGVSQNGIAGTSSIILVNILTTFRNNLIGYLNEPQWSGITWQGIMIYAVGLVIYLITIIFATVLFERSELRIPVYRVMMNNDLADVNYIAIKLNPAGTMPVMFAMIFFLIPYYLVEALLKIWQEQPVLLSIKGVLNLNNFTGITIYLFTAVLLNYFFSFVTINPSELSKNFMESGDCIAGLRPGKETLMYIKKCIVLCVIPSCIMQCTLVGLPLFAKAAYQSSSKAYQMPLTMIILTGVLLNVFEGVKVIRNFKDYKAFL